ncbi:hypothetical protein H0H81_004411 [Sphagnurus paluster]|uniref:Uncharacterized protein n=1 Tax=Sphagnurus paluster TaxID=117069 RepID=A0A9P7FWC1_9AGAR|nr:hypothetical protein H0H81_004411 [Sphagnurus paluster]
MKVATSFTFIWFTLLVSSLPVDPHSLHMISSADNTTVLPFAPFVAQAPETIVYTSRLVDAALEVLEARKMLNSAADMAVKGITFIVEKIKGAIEASKDDQTSTKVGVKFPVGKKYKYEVYWAGAGEFTLLGDGGFLNWAYEARGPVKRLEEGRKRVNSPAIGTGSIVGIAVAGGIAVIGIIAFLVWKFTRKRFSDFDDNEAIKWPELNAHGGNVDSHPLPVNNTGRAGFDTASDLSRVPSSSYSTPDLGGAGPDPYAVPPLPHMNPNQPYRDDPTAASGYYDPYRGPIPGTLEHGTAGDDWTGEAIPMTQMAGPHAAYATSEYDLGRRSPGPQAGGYGGRSSPGPQVAYGGRASPAPQSVYAAGRMSPAPQAAYEHYGVPR